ncbi:MAG TPA: bifunctional 4-hydroxy-2-oxoglutarate aldolase/2-dehydro-3-deoxy-phosphogluconate aldolase [Thermoanaerobaculia bacterium]|jgi:2-dehydro-3-deoxyphosphogluconate aldolase/(4S)-4-hydroxy-2-oxoglutarate aldolase|nr:bifunctional 4-hydroxy-2-oxoglutarate aldolase/2-dehydro-3-deoxy-phosphogluconate aldolase [Thermoanaerobaculia bacterium]
MAATVQLRQQVALSLRRSPIIGVVRTPSPEEALAQARALAAGGVELIEITFSVPGASGIVRDLLVARDAANASGGEGPPWYGMGTTTTAARAREAVAAGAEFLVTPNVSAEVAREARHAGLFLVMGALTCTEIVTAHELGADLVKVFPLPPVGGPDYLARIRGPLGDIPMLAAGGFGAEEIPAYARVGAMAFGIAAPLLGIGPGTGPDEAESRRRIGRALALARGGASLEEER